MALTNKTIENQPVQLIRTSSPGLSQAEVLELRKQHGENRLPAEKGTTVWTIVLNQIKSPLVYIILVAAGVSLLVKEYNDFIIIMAVVIIDVVLGFFPGIPGTTNLHGSQGIVETHNYGDQGW
jgi:magnesium-transporting ATPase (P-type)